MADGLTYSTEKPKERKIAELGIKIDKRASVPIFHQVENAIKYLIATGALLPSDRLPASMN